MCWLAVVATIYDDIQEIDEKSGRVVVIFSLYMASVSF